MIAQTNWGHIVTDFGIWGILSVALAVISGGGRCGAAGARA
jgi:hypothetical protein